MLDPELFIPVLWLGFGAAFAFRPKVPSTSVRRRDPRAVFGIVLQAVAYALVWFDAASRPLRLPTAWRWIGVAIGVASVVLLWSAVRHLGKQWAVQARVVEGHELVTSGPYAWVRHPIYTGMLGMLLATGLVLATVPRVLSSMLVFLVGMRFRTNLEEGLLRQEFGERFESYRQSAGWLLPGL
jgi:protein-S-isoprenylcysteine O-methyltransferase Ste14